VVKKYLAKHSVKALEHSPCSPDLSLPAFFLFPQLKRVFKGQLFVSAEEVTAKVTSGIEKMVSKNAPMSFMNIGKSVSAKRNYFQGNVVYIDVSLLISV
jgi:hypothetical protein